MAEISLPSNILKRNLIILIPLMLAVIAGFALIGIALGIDLTVGWIVVGAIGWLIALFLRAPVALVARRMSTDTQVIQRAIVLSSGFLEEGIRFLIFLFIASRDVSTAYSIGLGWGGIEVLYTLLNGFLTLQFLQRTDDEAVQAQKTLEEMGMLKPSMQYWGVIERISATAIHIGLTLLMASWFPWFILVAVPLHSATNYFVTKMMSRMALLQLILLCAGIVVFVLGLASFGMLGV